jgi:alcohol dehydrogenase (cytochrome c)
MPIGGQLGNGAIEATPLAEDGFLYITDNSGVLYKIDASECVNAPKPGQARSNRALGRFPIGNVAGHCQDLVVVG